MSASGRRDSPCCRVSAFRPRPRRTAPRPLTHSRTGRRGPPASPHCRATLVAGPSGWPFSDIGTRNHGEVSLVSMMAAPEGVVVHPVDPGPAVVGPRYGVDAQTPESGRYDVTRDTDEDECGGTVSGPVAGRGSLERSDGSRRSCRGSMRLGGWHGGRKAGCDVTEAGDGTRTGPCTAVAIATNCYSETGKILASVSRAAGAGRHRSSVYLQHRTWRHRRSKRHLVSGPRFSLCDHRLGREPDTARQSRTRGLQRRRPAAGAAERPVALRRRYF